MKKFSGYNDIKPLTETKRLPVDGYVIKIKDAREKEYEWGNVLVILFDIEEGEYRGFYKQNFDSQTQDMPKWKGIYRLTQPKDDGSEKDEITKRIFKTAMDAIEASNNGYKFDFDETKLKGKIVGAVFRNKEYEINGKSGYFTECYSFKSADAIREGNFTIPSDKRLAKNEGLPTGFTAVEDDDDDCDIPF